MNHYFQLAALRISFFMGVGFWILAQKPSEPIGNIFLLHKWHNSNLFSMQLNLGVDAYILYYFIGWIGLNDSSVV